MIEPRSEICEVELPLFVQVSERVSEAQVQVGAAPELGESWSNKVCRAEGSLGAKGTRHRALGGERGGGLQTGGPGDRYPGHWGPFLGWGRREFILSGGSLGAG